MGGCGDIERQGVASVENLGGGGRGGGVVFLTLGGVRLGVGRVEGVGFRAVVVAGVVGLVGMAEAVVWNVAGNGTVL